VVVSAACIRCAARVAGSRRGSWSGAAPPTEAAATRHRRRRPGGPGRRAGARRRPRRRAVAAAATAAAAGWRRLRAHVHRPVPGRPGHVRGDAGRPIRVAERLRSDDRHRDRQLRPDDRRLVHRGLQIDPATARCTQLSSSLAGSFNGLSFVPADQVGATGPMGLRWEGDRCPGVTRPLRCGWSSSRPPHRSVTLRRARGGPRAPGQDQGRLRSSRRRHPDLGAPRAGTGRTR